MTIIHQEIDITLSIEEQFRLEKLEDKKQSHSFEVAFCGHFSAGKSTILNELLGAKVLPTSPIPTSANIIRIINGELGLSILSKQEGEKAWKGEIPWEQVRQWGMNGNDISRITISAPLPFLSDYASILDTPGVDSTDESHEAVTVEQLYTTDVIVYVMDYNHVQSETNLYFLKQLSKERKPIFIVINQIDKHNEKEIPISIFKQSIKEIFNKWNIGFVNMYFTTMKNPDHSLNEFPRFEKDMKSLLYNNKDLLKGASLLLEQGFYQAVEHRLEEEKQEAVDEVKAAMKEKGYSLSQLKEMDSLHEEMEELFHYEETLRTNMEKELGSLFQNVTLFPFTTTDLARNWIESIQPGFKVGLLFTKRKTEEEQDQRLERLVNDLQDKVKSQLLFHVQKYFQQVDRSILSNVNKFEEMYNRLNFHVTADLLKEHVKTGHSNRDYVFQFTKEVTNTIVKIIRRDAIELLELQIKGMKEHTDLQIERITDKLNQLKEIGEYREKIEEIELTYSKEIELVERKLSGFSNNTQYQQQLVEATQQSYPVEKGNGFHNVTLPEESVIGTEWGLNEITIDTQFSEADTANWLGNIKGVLLPNQGNKVLGKERAQLLDRINRYEEQRFIISLFGAFSAGKSSFANALLGEEVLPVSPNPTTATINIVEKPSGDRKHGTAVINIKTEADLNKEIKAVSEQLDETLDLTTLLEWTPKGKQYITSTQKTYVEYLTTLQKSIGSTEWKLGGSFAASLSEVQQYAAEESKACLIEKITIYYDSPITNKGIVLVDTPGVNSIHGRHTNVAFQQMRQSDAIFYLTYYNHAFSKADQYFLQQMGKVNESFKHDKLYFVINAADLAGSVTELNGVRKHVHDQLKRNGMEDPRLYHLSSREGLKNKKARDKKETSFTQFEGSFYNHTILELKELSVNMISHQLQNYVAIAKDSLQFMEEEREEQVKKQQSLMETVKAQQENIKNLTFTYAVRDVFQELEQLVLYLKDRMRYVLNDYYSTAINVAVLTGNSKRELHEQLQGAIKDWKGLGEHFLKQELEATLIRIEERVKARSKVWLKDELKKLKEELPYINEEVEVLVQPLNIEGDINISVEVNNYRSFLSSKKDFFENGKVKELKEKLVEDGVEASVNTIEKQWGQLKDQLQVKLNKLEMELKQQLNSAVEAELDRFSALFDVDERISLQKEYDSLKKYIV
ncbi:small GTP-binding protein [Evansella vedderi]|uniref:Small GTP-binding protein n=1 Tax=Evansella vedderi TaxID=38282 RepID=A0ABU0A324_9BACI|nr:dynamin family protein [Evansella vedderi]MDQ0257893.1 small GTP-binding protein [Evansella vedderi]